MVYDILIVGAGVCGGMIARELSKYDLRVCLLEKANDVAAGASKANSGIIHGGYDPEPGTLKQKLNTEGVKLLFEAAEELSVPYLRNGSMVCAFSEYEEEQLRELYSRGISNGVQGLKLLSGDEARALESNLSQSVTLALHVPEAGIICPYKLTIAAVGNAMDNGVTLMRNFEVTSIKHKDGFFGLTSSAGDWVSGKYLINCAGGYSGKIAAMAGDDSIEIIPRAGEYMLLDRSEGKTVSHTIFRAPSKEGKGIVVSPTADGNLLLGPTAVRVDTPDSTETTREGLAAVIRSVKESVPTVDLSKVITSFTGVRASHMDGDFIIAQSKLVKNLVNVAAIDSPGLTACAAIARYVTDILDSMGVKLCAKPDWNGKREDTEAFSKLTDEQKDAVIKKDPAYGRIICRCEGITEGEIRHALRKNPPALDMDGVKRRSRSGMGRCQGGFCAPYVMKLIAEEQGIKLEEVTKNGGGSKMLTGRI